jgi:hypothetical protein
MAEERYVVPMISVRVSNVNRMFFMITAIYWVPKVSDLVKNKNNISPIPGKYYFCAAVYRMGSRKIIGV